MDDDAPARDAQAVDWPELITALLIVAFCCLAYYAYLHSGLAPSPAA